ncbi:MAG: hypothetical protein IPK87_16640 [Planctomycetes bacterium]|nr:hypothetical protein [Planctomycetota bacterium]
MWLILFKFTRWVYKTLNSDVRPWQIALGFTLGALAGLLPLGLGTLAVFTLILLLNVHFGSAMFSFGTFRLLAWLLQVPVIRPVGEAALDIAPQSPLVAAASTPILAWLRLDYFDVAGAIAIWLILALPLFVSMAALWTRFREWMDKRLKNSRFMKWASKVWLFKGLRYVFVG